MRKVDVTDDHDSRSHNPKRFEVKRSAPQEGRNLKVQTLIPGASGRKVPSTSEWVPKQKHEVRRSQSWMVAEEELNARKSQQSSRVVSQAPFCQTAREGAQVPVSHTVR